MPRVHTVPLTVLAVCLVALYSPGAAHADGLRLGFLDGEYTTPERDPWLQRTADVGADVVRLDVGWVAPNTPVRPAGFRARDPADPAYDFSVMDASVRAADVRGLRIILSFAGAPRWAEGPGRPQSAAAGSWRPDPAAVGDYGSALARRYSGSFPDPGRPGRALPRVMAFQLWNEPNLVRYLTPQWVSGANVAPGHYRRMLNAFYDGVKSVQPNALVVTAGTAPFGDALPSAGRTMPAMFVRKMLCLRRSRRGLRPTKCASPPRFDVLSHHPYSVGAPRRPAGNVDDVSIPDIGKLTRLLRAAEHHGTVRPRTRHRMWVTEVSYDSRGPDPGGVPLERHARFLEETMYLLWRQGVDTITWYQVRDQAPAPDFGSTAQSGIFFRDGRVKPAARAFRFPFVAVRGRGTRVRVWGRAPATGNVRIEVATRRGWRLVRTVRAQAHDVFSLRIRTRATRLRARAGSDVSLTWTVH